MVPPRHRLRLNLGDPSEARLYYLPHALAEAAGLFAREGLEVAFLTATGGGHTAMGGQLGAVAAGEADLAVGGPMVTMKLQAEGGARLVNFCALVRANPWVIASPRPLAARGLADLRGHGVVDAANVATARFCFLAAREAAGLDEAALPLLAGRGEADLAACAQGEAGLVHHHLHALAPWIAAGRLHPVLSMAGPTGAVPWSAYIAQAERLAADPEPFAAFRRAIGAALALLARESAAALAQAVGPHYPGYDRAALAWAIDYYRAAGLWAPDPAMPRAEFAHFATLMQRAGWLDAPPDIDALIAPEIAR